MVKLQIDRRMPNMLYKFQFFNGKYYTNIEIVECQSGRIAQKWSNAGQICGCRSIRSQPNGNARISVQVLAEQIQFPNYGIISPCVF